MSKKRTDVKESEKPILLSGKKKTKVLDKTAKKETKQTKNSFLNYIQKNKNKQISNDYNCLSKTNKRKKNDTDETVSRQGMRSKRILRECAYNTRVFPLHIVAYVFPFHPLPVPPSNIPNSGGNNPFRSSVVSFHFVHQPVVGCKVGRPPFTHTPEVRLTLPGYGQPDSRGELSRAV